MKLLTKLIPIAALSAACLCAQQPGNAEVTIANSATPTLTCAGGITHFTWTLQQNVTGSTFSCLATASGSLLLCEDGTGGRSVAFPANFVNFAPMAKTTLNYCQNYTWQYNSATGNVTATGDANRNPVLAVYVSDVTAVTSNQSVTLATTPGTGFYKVVYYADLNTSQAGCFVSFAFGWTDSTAARTLNTGNLFLSSGGLGYISGAQSIYVASGNVTYTSTLTGCGSGSYDIHAVLEVQ